MKVRPSIRIIRREVRERREKCADAAATHKEATGDAARDISITVVSWIREFRQGQQTQSKTPIKNLFATQRCYLPRREETSTILRRVSTAW